jgi:hypothetical protein
MGFGNSCRLGEIGGLQEGRCNHWPFPALTALSICWNVDGVLIQDTGIECAAFADLLESPSSDLIGTPFVLCLGELSGTLSE